MQGMKGDGGNARSNLCENCVTIVEFQGGCCPKWVLCSPLSNLGPVYGSQISDKEPAKLVVS